MKGILSRLTEFSEKLSGSTSEDAQIAHDLGHVSCVLPRPVKLAPCWDFGSYGTDGLTFLVLPAQLEKTV